MDIIIVIISENIRHFQRYISAPFLSAIVSDGKGIMAIRDGIACINILPNYVRSDCNWFNQRFRKEKIGGRETMRTKKGSSEAPDFYNPRAFFKSRDEKLGRHSRVFG